MSISVDLKMPVRDFLRDYWQKKPLFVKGAVSLPDDLFSGEELAGLALEENTESRLVFREKNGRKWVAEKGPFSTQTFTSLPEEGWSLLVQDVDKFLPEISALKESFRFIPDWRLDDIMISYSPKGGGVGPHLDLYDVFLIQGPGKRHWDIDERRTTLDQEPHLEDADLRIMTEFTASEGWDMEPGDLLYLPPGFPHQGVSLCPSLTFSVGFRSPSYGDVMRGFAGFLADSLSEDERYEDPDLKEQDHPAEISSGSLEKIRAGILQKLQKPGVFEHWFGCHITELKGGNACGFKPEPPDTLFTVARLRMEIPKVRWFCRDEGSQLAFMETGDELQVFVNGTGYLFPLTGLPWIKVLTGSYRLEQGIVRKTIDSFPLFGEFFCSLLNEGIFYMEE